MVWIKTGRRAWDYWVLSNNGISRPGGPKLLSECTASRIRQKNSQKNNTALTCYNIDVHQPILVIFGENAAKNVVLLFFRV